MEQALASDMWGTPYFEEAYLQMAEEWEELTDWLEWETPLLRTWASHVNNFTTGGDTVSIGLVQSLAR